MKVLRIPRSSRDLRVSSSSTASVPLRSPDASAFTNDTLGFPSSVCGSVEFVSAASSAFDLKSLVITDRPWSTSVPAFTPSSTSWKKNGVLAICQCLSPLYLSLSQTEAAPALASCRNRASSSLSRNCRPWKRFVLSNRAETIGRRRAEEERKVIAKTRVESSLWNINRNRAVVREPRSFPNSVPLLPRNRVMLFTWSKATQS